MSRLIVIENDVVSNTGKDKHGVIGSNISSGTPVATQFSYDYSGKVKEKSGGNDFVTIKGVKIITKGHNECPQTQNHVPSNVTAADAGTLASWLASNALTGFGIIPGTPDEPDNNGENSNDAGSSFVTILETPVILDGDNFDTCHAAAGSNSGRSKNSSVAASEQNFVTASE